MWWEIESEDESIPIVNVGREIQSGCEGVIAVTLFLALLLFPGFVGGDFRGFSILERASSRDSLLRTRVRNTQRRKPDWRKESKEKY